MRFEIHFFFYDLHTLLELKYFVWNKIISQNSWGFTLEKYQKLKPCEKKDIYSMTVKALIIIQIL